MNIMKRSKFIEILRVKLILFGYNIKHPKRYLLKLKYFQRPLFLLQIRRLIYRFSHSHKLTRFQELSIRQLFKKGISSYYDGNLGELLVKIGNQYKSLPTNGKEHAPGYISLPLSSEYKELILPYILPMADYYFGGKNSAKIRSSYVSYISKKTCQDTKIKSSTDFWHIDTPNQLTMHLFCGDVNKDTPHLAYSSTLHNKNLIDFYAISGEKNAFSFFKNIFPHKVFYAFGHAGSISIFDPNGMHKDVIPIKSSNPRIYILINFTPGNL